MNIVELNDTKLNAELKVNSALGWGVPVWTFILLPPGLLILPRAAKIKKTVWLKSSMLLDGAYGT